MPAIFQKCLNGQELIELRLHELDGLRNFDTIISDVPPQLCHSVTVQQSPVYSAAVDIESDDFDVYGETDGVWGWRTKPDPKLQLLNETLDKRAHMRQDSQKSQAAGAATDKPPTACTVCFTQTTQTTPLWHQFPEGRTLCNACCLFVKGSYGGALPLSSTRTPPKQTYRTTSSFNLSSSAKGQSHRLQVQCDHCFQKGKGFIPLCILLLLGRTDRGVKQE
jgi:hypothetical protein